MTIPDINPSSWLSLYENGNVSLTCDVFLMQGGLQGIKLNVAGFGTANTSPLLYSYSAGRVIRYAENTLLAVERSGLWRSVDSGANWIQIHAFTSYNNIDDARRLGRTGIFPLFDGTNFLFGGIFWDATGMHGWTWEPDTDTYTENDIGNTYSAANDMAFQDQVLLGNTICFTADSGSFSYANPITGTGSEIGITGLQATAILRGSSLCTLDGRIYLIYTTDAGPGLSTHDVAYWDGATSWVAFGLNMDGPNGTGRNISSNVQGYKTTCFQDPETGDLIAIFEDVPLAARAWACHRINVTTMTSQDITADVLPLGLRSSESGGLMASNYIGQARRFIDTQSSPGDVGIFVMLTNRFTGRDGLGMWQWKGVSDPMRWVGSISGATLNCDMPELQIGGGMGMFTPGTKFTRVKTRGPAGAHQRISFRPFGGGTVDLEFRFAEEMGIPTTQCTLTGTPNQGTLNGNILEGVTADGLLKTVDWNAGIQGVGNEQANVLLYAGEV